MIKHGKVFVAIFRSAAISKMRIASSSATGANPVCYTVGRQGIMIPTNISSICRSTLEPVPFIIAEPTIAPAVWG